MTRQERQYLQMVLARIARAASTHSVRRKLYARSRKQYVAKVIKALKPKPAQGLGTIIQNMHAKGWSRKTESEYCMWPRDQVQDYPRDNPRARQKMADFLEEQRELAERQARSRIRNMWMKLETDFEGQQPEFRAYLAVFRDYPHLLPAWVKQKMKALGAWEDDYDSVSHE